MLKGSNIEFKGSNLYPFQFLALIDRYYLCIHTVNCTSSFYFVNFLFRPYSLVYNVDIGQNMLYRAVRTPKKDNSKRTLISVKKMNDYCNGIPM